MKKILIMSVIALAFNSFATQIRDDYHHLAKLDKFLGNPTFEQSFKTGEFSIFEQELCSYSLDTEICRISMSELEVRDINRDRVVLTSSDFESDYDYSITKSLFDLHGGNYVKLFFSDESRLISSYLPQGIDDGEAYEFEVLSARETVVTHLGEQRRAMIISGILKWEDGFVAQTEFEIVKGMSFVAMLNNFKINLLGLAQVSMSLKEYRR